ncbi:YggS family pyridoxal phosphate-dependent enzyme [Opitutus terrae]|uniref:Pyridoxal phosphate homeostasis protein n=1 Tax=Opitutus terrae (strain DSM 11246 / JCM 15787 / PB90-1) TaxID=452637 RepID=B1ZRU5_OPITP|nr:YggS family pyridoxal phosphate-dependent enzyme [Opitutus terrae]ACB73788.1 alanine racemase domain protein [Opitutus terrae PB90-1]
MFLSYEAFRAAADAISKAIVEACIEAGRRPGEVQLLPVTKTQPAAAADYVARYGLPAVGENRVQEAIEKRAQTQASVRWELIGHLQSNKARIAAQQFDRIQSVDRAKLLDPLDRAAAELGKTLPVLLQVNAGRDPAKFGAELEDAPQLLEQALGRPHLRVEGLMTIAPLSSDPEVARRTFAALRTLRDELAARFGVPLSELSMGMTSDFRVAIAEGSTTVRVGTALFGARAALGQ